MARTKVSSKYQVVIPKEIRERHGLKPGHEMQVISKAARSRSFLIAALRIPRIVARDADNGIPRKERPHMIVVDSSGCLSF